MSPYICHFMQSEENTLYTIRYLVYKCICIINNNIAGPWVRPQECFEYKELFLIDIGKFYILKIKVTIGPSFCMNFFSSPSSSL